MGSMPPPLSPRADGRIAVTTEPTALLVETGTDKVDTVALACETGALPLMLPAQLQQVPAGLAHGEGSKSRQLRGAEKRARATRRRSCKRRSSC